MINKFFLLIKNKDNRRLFTNFISLFSIKGVDFLIPLLIFPYLVRTLGIDVFGLLAFSTAFCVYFGAIIHYGYSISAVRDISRVKSDEKALGKLYSSLISLSFVLVFVCVILIMLLLIFIPSLKEYWLLHICSFFHVAMFSLFPAWFFQGIEKMKFIAYINLSTKILYILSLFLLVTGPEDFILVPFLHGFFMTISVLASFIIIHFYLKIKYERPSIKELKGVLKSGKHSFIIQLAPTLYNSTTTFILGYTSSNTIVGIYASAIKLIYALNSASIIISTTFLPYLSVNLSKHKMFSYIMWFIGVTVTLLAFIFSDTIILFFYGNENLIVSTWFRALVPMVLFIFIRNTYGPNFLMLIDKERTYKNIVLYTCLVFFVLSILIVPKFNLQGGVFIMVGTTAIMCFSTLYYYFKHRKINKI